MLLDGGPQRQLWRPEPGAQGRDRAPHTVHLLRGQVRQRTAGCACEGSATSDSVQAHGRIVLSQLSGSGRGGLASYNSKQYDALTTFLEEEPLRDGDAWLKGLLARDEMLGAPVQAVCFGSRAPCALLAVPERGRLRPAALRVMEVRQAYAAESFEWDQLQRLAIGIGQVGAPEHASVRAPCPGSAAAHADPHCSGRTPM